MAMTLTSSAFQQGGAIPARYTCDGENVSPPLAWGGVPGNTQSLALIVDDPDAPDPRAPRGVWVHWVLYNLQPAIASLTEGISALPPGATAGANDFKKIGYGGPCPPIGRHRYYFTLYALDATLPELGHATKAQIEHAMGGHILAKAQLIGTYEHHR